MSIAALQPLSRSQSETERLAAVGCWTDDPAIAPLMTAIRALIPVGEMLRELSAQRPSVDRLVSDEIGSLMRVVVETGRVHVWQCELRPTGIIAQIWTELDALRRRWITARLHAEGLESRMTEVGPWYDRLQELEDQAPTVTDLWNGKPGEAAPPP